MKQYVRAMLIACAIIMIQAEEIYKGDDQSVVNKKLMDNGYVMINVDNGDPEINDFITDGLRVYAYSRRGGWIYIRVAGDGKVDGIKMILKDKHGKVTYAHLVNQCAFSGDR